MSAVVYAYPCMHMHTRICIHSLPFDYTPTLICTPSIPLPHHTHPFYPNPSTLPIYPHPSTPCQLCQHPAAYLPWAHVFGQTAELHSLLATGSCMAIVSNREQILESLAIVRPTMIASVPVLFNKVYDGVMKKVKEGSRLSRFVFDAALGVARRRNALLEFGKPGACCRLQTPMHPDSTLSPFFISCLSLSPHLTINISLPLPISLSLSPSSPPSPPSPSPSPSSPPAPQCPPCWPCSTVSPTA